MSKTGNLISTYPTCSYTFPFSVHTFPLIQLPRPKALESSFISLFLSHSISQWSKTYILNIYPESCHFLPAPMLPLWLKPQPFLTWTVAVASWLDLWFCSQSLTFYFHRACRKTMESHCQKHLKIHAGCGYQSPAWSGPWLQPPLLQVGNSLSELFQLRQETGSLSPHSDALWDAGTPERGHKPGVRNMKMCSREVRETQIQTITTYYFVHTRIAIIRTQKISNIGEDIEKLEPSHIADESVNCYTQLL